MSTCGRPRFLAGRAQPNRPRRFRRDDGHLRPGINDAGAIVGYYQDTAAAHGSAATPTLTGVQDVPATVAVLGLGLGLAALGPAVWRRRNAT